MYNKKNVKELKAIARSRNIRGYYNMRKAELVYALNLSEFFLHLGFTISYGDDKAPYDPLGIFNQRELCSL